jgi:hypothetical protein
MAYSIASVVAMKRGSQWVTNYAAKADDNFDTVNTGVVNGGASNGLSCEILPGPN